MRQPQDSQLATLQADLKNLLSSLQDHRTNVSEKLTSLDHKLEYVGQQQQRSIDELEEKLMRMFVLRAEYEPKHAVVLDKINEYDRIISSARAREGDWVTVKNAVSRHEEDIDHIKLHASGWPSRVLPWVAVLVSLAAVLLNYAQHIVIR